MLSDYLPFLFFGLALAFALLAFKDYASHQWQMSIRARTWRRIALVFMLIGVLISVMRNR